MNSFALDYSKANQVQREDAKHFLKQYANVIQWRNDGKETLLDVGCGPGDVTYDFLLPIMPKQFGKLVGVDILMDMVKHARSLYERENIAFHQLDIEGDITTFQNRYPEGFDHITSLYCLHWVKDQRKSTKNIYDLLKSDGDCLLVYLMKHPMYDLFEELSKNSKWNAAIANCDIIFPPLHRRMINPVADLTQLFQTTGFRKYNMKSIHHTHVYTGLNTIKDNMTVVNPIWTRMSPSEQDEYFEKYVEVATKMGIFKKNKDERKCKFEAKCHVIIVYANK